MADGIETEIRLYERLFSAPHPGAAELLDELNRDSLQISTGYVEAALAAAAAGAAYQFERHGYFVADGARAVRFNRASSLRDSWGK